MTRQRSLGAPAGALDRFKNALRGLMAVPKSELDDKIAERQRPPIAARDR